MIAVTDRIALDEDSLEEHFIRASGPGGQNVNKVASAVQLRFAIARLIGADEFVRERLARLAGKRLTQEGEIVITAQRFRARERNRADAIERLVALIRRAAEPVTPRRPTRPTRASRIRRRTAKSHLSRLKRQRGAASPED